jgi:hypothetical protein
MDIFAKVWYAIAAYPNAFGVMSIRVQLKKNDPKSWQSLTDAECEKLVKIVNTARRFQA